MSAQLPPPRPITEADRARIKRTNRIELWIAMVGGAILAAALAIAGLFPF